MRQQGAEDGVVEVVDGVVAAHDAERRFRVATAKPDIYPEARGVGVEVASFE